jgi:hypothetical protein
MARYHITGGAVQTTVSGSVASSGAVTVTITDATGWPDASVGPYHVVIDPGESNEEVVLVTARSGTSLTVTSGNRGADGTSAAAHSNGAVIYPCISATIIDEANAHQNSSSVHLGSGTVQTAHFAAGAVDAAALGSSAVTEAKINAGAVTEAKLGTGAVTETKLGAGSVVEAKLGAGAVTEAKLGSSAVTAGKIASDAVTTAKILDANVTTAKLADDSVTSAKMGLTEIYATQTQSTDGDGSAPNWIVPWQTEVVDTAGILSSGVVTFTAATAGLWLVSAHGNHYSGSTSTTTNARLRVVVDSTVIIEGDLKNAPDSSVDLSVCGLVLVEDGDQLWISNHRSTSGGATTFGGRLHMVKLR